MAKSSKGKKAKKGKAKKASGPAASSLETTTTASSSQPSASSNLPASTSAQNGPTPAEMDKYHRFYKATLRVASEGLGVTTQAIEQRFSDASKGIGPDIKMFKAYFEACVYQVRDVYAESQEKEKRQANKGKKKEESEEEEDENERLGYIFNLAVCLAYQGLAHGSHQFTPGLIEERIQAAIPTLGANDRLFYAYFTACLFRSTALYKMGGKEIRDAMNQTEKKEEDQKFAAMYGAAEKLGFFDVD